MEVIIMSQRSSHKIYEGTSDKIFDIINTTLLIIAFLVVLYPLIYIFSSSISTSSAVISGRVWLWPVGFDLDGYRAVFNHKSIMLLEQ
jgi:multiple sugar transport system permease protein/putative aldouronate transport system permease protein